MQRGSPAGLADDSTEEIDIRLIVGRLIHWSPGIALVTAVAVLVAFWITASAEPTYSSTVTVAAPRAQGEDGIGMPVAIYAELAGGDVTRAFVDAQVGGRPGEYVVKVKDEMLLEVTATSEHADTAQDIARAWLVSFTLQVDGIIQGQITTRRTALERLDAIYAQLPETEVDAVILAETADLALKGYLVAAMSEMTVLDGPTNPVGEDSRIRVNMMLAGLIALFGSAALFHAYLLGPKSPKLRSGSGGGRIRSEFGYDQSPRGPMK